MSTKNETENQLAKLLKTATSLNLSANFTLDVKSSAGNGFTGEFYKILVHDKETDQKYDIVAKKAPSIQSQRATMLTKLIYKNEVYFYETLHPALEKFGKVDFLPKYITHNATENEEVIVLEDVTAQGFKMRDKNLLLDDAHVELIFSTYGQFHAQSFVWKYKNAEDYGKYTRGISDVTSELSEKPFGEMIFAICRQQGGLLDPVQDSKLLEKFQRYIDDPKKVFKYVSNYQGEYSAILHGDCWSNNMMFKYDNSIPVAMKLLDFQLLNEGTPVYDLSYFFYTGATKGHFDRLDYFLDIYYTSFTRRAKNLGISDPEQLFPREQLSKDWETYAKYGMFLSFLLTRIKSMSLEETLKFMRANAITKPELKTDLFMNVKCDEEAISKRIQQIIRHMYEIEAL